MTSFEKAMLRFAVLHLALVLTLSTLFRIYILFMHGGGDWPSVVYGMAVGPVFDFATGIYSFLPFALILLVWPKRWALGWLFAIDVFAFLFNLVSEFVFYDEFHDRFNFIAVDYLVYTHEVLANIWESYPLIKILLGLAAVSAFLTWFLARPIFFGSDLSQRSLRGAARSLVIFAGAFIVFLAALNEARFLAGTNYLQEVIAKNGLHALFAAYRNNEINFDRFYTSTDSKRAASFVHNSLRGLESPQLPHSLEVDDSIIRNVTETEEFRRLNVMLVVMESMSARFMKSYGNPNDLTPNLDRMAKEGLFFDRVYSTGTRTVRGLEAVVLSIPPTPGQSIVRRPAGVGLFNIGTPFREQKYKTTFVYGGRALFDNMGEFFRGNGFDVLDQSAMPSSEIHFTNAWGVSDEDLFNQSIKSADESYAHKQNFLQVILNTTNHRPYTYPEGRVAIPSGKGRDGAVQYSDYAIGKFVEDARKKPWFDDTIFVFVADHNAAVAGQNQIDPNDYLIPLIFYSPKWIKPKVVHSMGSQIDLAPTLLEFLNASYQSRFFGMELQEANPGRAFLGTYQSVGYLTENSLTVLSPNRRVDRFSWDGKTPRLLKTEVIKSLGPDMPADLTATVAYYKTASDWFSQRLLEEKYRVAADINRRK